MSLRRAVIAVVVLAAIAAYDGGRLNSQSSPAYTVVDFGPAPGNAGSGGSDLNEFGTILGNAPFPQCCPSSTYFVPFVLQDGVFTQLPLRGIAAAMNDRGQIAGTNSSTNRAFLYTNGTATELDTAVFSSSASGLNFSGDVAGTRVTQSGNTLVSRTFLYQGGTLQPLSFDLPSPVLNDAGELAGNQLYSGGLLIPFSQSRSFLAHRINTRGDVVGQTTSGSPDRAFLFSGGTLTMLGTLPGFDSSDAAGINDAGTIVGTASTLTGHRRGFIFANGTMTDLNAIAAVPSGYTILAATAINESGYVTAEISNTSPPSSHLALLVPTTPAAPVVTYQPEMVSTVAGSSATFFAVARGVPLPSYKWQSSTDGGANWSDLTDNSVYSGTATARLTAASVTTAQSGIRFRAVATNASGSAASAAVALIVTSSPVAPTITTQPANVASGERQNATFTVSATGTAPLTYQWRRDGTAIPGAVYSTLHITDVQPDHAGSYSVVVTNTAGSATSTTATLVETVPTAILTPDVLYFGAERNASSGTATVSPAQDVAVRFSTGAPAWSVSADQSWVTLTNASGTGAGRFTVAVNASALPAGTTATATLTFTVPSATLTTTMAVRLTIQPAVSTAGPFGAFDTPSGGSTVAGSVAVTGWGLDDVGVDRVEIWRDLVSGETTPPFSSTPTDPRNGKVFIANATFVAGSRPDIESAYPTTPAVSRAGWGYLLLTYGLWNRGNGTYNLYAFAFDRDAHVTTLGTRTITSNNAAATKPFGSIDTPDQGATVSGTVTNFGWALTPGTTCTVAGGSVQVSIDSGPLQPVTYGGARTDIAAAFPGYTDANAAGGSYTLNTTALSNGLHTIGWFVTDSCGRADGVGSRFFTVANAGLRTAASAATMAQMRALAWTPIAARVDAGEWTSIAATTTGDRVVAVAQDQRLELQIPSRGRLTGRLIVNGSERPLPIGSSLDATAGVFRWQPAPGFLGRFDLVFVDGAGTATRVRVLVRPAR